MRAIRANVDIERRPSATAGMITDAGPSTPDEGSQRRPTAKTMIIRMPVRNVGRLWPVTTSAAIGRSNQRPRQTAIATPCRDADADRHDQRRARKRQRVGNARRENIPGGYALHDGHAKFEPCEPRQEGEILAPDRLVEAELAPERLDMLPGRTFGHQQEHGIAGQAHDEEDDRHHAKVVNKAWSRRETR